MFGGKVKMIALAALVLLQIVPGSALARTTVDINFGGGYRVDQVDWNIAGELSPGTFVDVLSELRWRELESYQLRADLRAVRSPRHGGLETLFTGRFAYGWIFDGENQDSDYAGSGRTLEFSRSENDAGDGEVFDLTAGAGVIFTFGGERFSFAPLFGYSLHRQYLTMTDGLQTVSRSDLYPDVQDLGPFAGLDSSYETRWHGPWLGCELGWRPHPRFSLAGTFEYHWADYHAEAQWNLREDFAQPKSFEHDADGAGIVLEMRGDYFLTSQWTLFVSASWQDWRAEDGVDRVFLASGAVGTTPLNEVNWESQAYQVGLSCRF